MARARKLEFENERTIGGLLPTSMVNETFFGLVEHFEREVQALPFDVAIEIAAASDHREVFRILRRECVRFLDSGADWLEMRAKELDEMPLALLEEGLPRARRR